MVGSGSRRAERERVRSAFASCHLSRSLTKSISGKHGVPARKILQCCVLRETGVSGTADSHSDHPFWDPVRTGGTALISLVVGEEDTAVLQKIRGPYLTDTIRVPLR